MKGAFTQAQLFTGLSRVNLVLAVKFKEMAHEVRGMPVMELAIFFSDIVRQGIPQPLLPEPLFPRGLRPQTPGVFRFGPGLICPPNKKPRAALRASRGPLARDQPLD